MKIETKAPNSVSTRVASSNKKLTNNKPAQTKADRFPQLDKAKISEEAKRAGAGANPGQILGLSQNFGAGKDTYTPWGTGEGLGKQLPPAPPSSEPWPTVPTNPRDPYGTGDGLDSDRGRTPQSAAPKPWEFRPGYNPAGTGGL